MARNRAGPLIDFTSALFSPYALIGPVAKLATQFAAFQMKGSVQDVKPIVFHLKRLKQSSRNSARYEFPIVLNMNKVNDWLVIGFRSEGSRFVSDEASRTKQILDGKPSVGKGAHG
jgi:hypothetical protein